MAPAATDESHANEHGHIEHVYSPSALIIGIGAFFTYLGIGVMDTGNLVSIKNVILPVGIVIGLAGFANWIREDVAFWTRRWEVPGIRDNIDVDWWGMIFFLGTEVMLFGGLFAAYFTMRAEFPTEFESVHLPVVLTGINTLILLTSGLTVHYAVHAIKHDNRKGFIYGMVATIVLGAIFLGIQVMEYVELIAEGIVLGSTEFGHFASPFYILTGTHGFHVFLGLVFLVIVLWRGMKGQFDSERHTAVDAFAIYWHFVDVVWILLYFILYVGVV